MIVKIFKVIRGVKKTVQNINLTGEAVGYLVRIISWETTLNNGSCEQKGN